MSLSLLSRLASRCKSPNYRSIRDINTIAQTVNLAKPETCARPRHPAVQKLVSADPLNVDPCPHRNTSYRQACPVRVRVCRREDLERMCPLKFCDCPQKKSPKTLKKRLCDLAVFSTKSAVVAGLVYWTRAEGFWGDPEDTEENYTRIRQTIAADPELESVELPKLEYLKFKLFDMYNRAVLSIMGVLVGVPMKIDKKIRDTFFPCEPVVEEKNETGAKDKKK